MFGSVKSRPNFYETLGLTPAANDDDIAKAFATRLRIDITSPEEADEHADRVFAAYETLRDPFRRRLYDASLGLPTEPPQPPGEESSAGDVQPFIGSQPEGPTENGVGASPNPAPQQRPEATAEQRVAPFIAAALRDPIEHSRHDGSPDPTRPPEPQHRPDVSAEQNADADGAGNQPLHLAEERSAAPDHGQRRSQHNFAGLGAGAAVLILGVLTLTMGLLRGNADRAPSSSQSPAAVHAPPAIPSNDMSQIATPQAAPVDVGVPPFPVENDATSLESIGSTEAGPNPMDGALATSPAPTTVATDSAAAETPSTARPESTAIESSAATSAAATAPASSASADPLAPLPPPPAAQSPPPAAARPIVSRPAIAPPPPAVNRSAPARWISGGLVKADNPRGQLRGTVTVQFTILANGRVAGCRTSASSGNRALDARTCQLLEQRLRFSPALNPQGRPIASETRATYNWGVKHRPLVKQLWNLIRR
jgi:TonB family protein